MTGWKTRRFFVLLLALTAVLAACTDGPASQQAIDESFDEGSAVVNALAAEFSLTLEQVELAAGRTTFVVENRGSAAHNFVLRGNGLEESTPVIEPGASGTLTIDLEPGTYAYRCTTGGHHLLGMRGSLTVTAGGLEK